MSAAAARRRKQLAARNAQQDNVGSQLSQILANNKDDMDEATAYEALQLAQSQVRKKIATHHIQEGCELCYTTGLALLQKGRVSVASQLLALLTDVLRETHTPESDEWLDRMEQLQQAHVTAMEKMTKNKNSLQETTRLERLQRDWLLRALQWSADIGTTRFGHNRLQALLGHHCWKLANLEQKDDAATPGLLEDEEIAELQCDAVQHMALAEDPQTIITWLQTLPEPTPAETKAGHTCPPALRDALFTRAILLLAAVENLRDANALLQGYVESVESRDPADLALSYTDKNDGQAPSHAMFANMLLRILCKDRRTGPLYSWLMRSFQRELDMLYKPQTVAGFCTKIGKIYFNIQPPPNMMSMMENMMGMMGGAGGGMGGGPNPAMMQALAAQMQKGGMR